MYGLVNSALEDLVVSKFGEPTWEAIKVEASVNVEVFISNETYSDATTYALVGAASKVLGLSGSEMLHKFGEHWICETASRSYGPLMRSGGETLLEFLENLPNLHTRVAMLYPNLEPPRFRFEALDHRQVRLHYMTHRPGLTDFVVGLLSGLSKLFHTPCSIDVVERKDAGASHDVFLITV